MISCGRSLAEDLFGSGETVFISHQFVEVKSTKRDTTLKLVFYYKKKVKFLVEILNWVVSNAQGRR